MKYRFDSIGPPYSMRIDEEPAETSSYFEAENDQSAIDYAEWLVSERLRFVTVDGAKRGRAKELIELGNPPRVVKAW